VNPDPEPLRCLDTLDGYRKNFMDAGLWQPYIAWVAARHNLPSGEAHPGLAGTYPTFSVNELWVVKFFGRLFDGEWSFEVELEAARVLAGETDIPAPAVMASGRLFDDAESQHWPYLVFNLVSGSSFGECRKKCGDDEKKRIAAELGHIVRSLHKISTKGSTIFRQSWQPYRRFLQAQKRTCVKRLRRWQVLPVRLLEQVGNYLPPLDELVDDGLFPHMIHADLTGDHLLGKVEGGHWQTLGLIDFGDARVGSLYYELCALYLDLFQGDPELLSIFLDAYGLSARARHNLPRRLLATALLHQFDVLHALKQNKMKFRDYATLKDIEKELYP
jgi:hygromycin-B 7''-O-kinase